MDKLVPEVRFKGFTDDWELCKLGDVSDIVGGGTPSTSNSKYWNGTINWFSPAEIGNQIYISNSNSKITEIGMQKSSARLLPIGTVLFTSRAGIGKTAILKKKSTTNQGFQSIIPHKYELNSYFIFSQTPKLKTYGEKTGAGFTFIEVSGKQMSKMPIYIPQYKEQKEIGSFLKKVDETLGLYNKILEQYRKIKNTLLQQMFASDGDLLPKMRFADFQGDWEQCKAKKLFIPITEKGHPDLPVLSVTQNMGVVKRMDVGIDIKYDSKTLKNYKVVDYNDFVISLRSFQGGFELSSIKEIVSPAYTVFRIKDIENNCYLFWKSMFKRHDFIQSLKTITFGIRDGKSISFTEFKTLKITYPSKYIEQKEIGESIKKINDFIYFQKKEITFYQGIKKFLLQNMFL